jgi:hypothetical protein
MNAASTSKLTEDDILSQFSDTPLLFAVEHMP